MLEHALDEGDTATNIIFIVLHGLLDRLADSLQTCKMDHRFDWAMACEDVIEATLVANVDLLEYDHVVDLSRDRLHAFKANS